jgi:hypothetical protein
MTETLLTRLTQIPGFRSLWRRFPRGSVETRVRFGIFSRPNYAYGVYSAAHLGKRLGLDAIQVIEFGVAGGRGLLALEQIAAEIAAESGVRIHVAGFDSGSGMPAPLDYRDLPYVWDTGFYAMDVARLKASLKPSTELVLGDVGRTVLEWQAKAPIGFVSFDLDYYSSTKQAFGLFNRPAGELLPRIYSYFDDLMWPEHAGHNDRIGELCAIREFNEENPDKCLSRIHMLEYMLPHRAAWNEQMYMLHDFKHPLYSRNITQVGDQYRQLALS